MKRLKFLPISIVAALLVGIVSFSACKKDKDSLTPKDFANDVCACMDKSTTSAINSCMDNLEVKYAAFEDDDFFFENAAKEMSLGCAVKLMEWADEEE